MEWQYYFYANSRKDCCFYCGRQGGSVDIDLKNEFKIVLPLCEVCKADGKAPMKWAPYKHKGQSLITENTKKKSRTNV